jgi:hypothetical protein
MITSFSYGASLMFEKDTVVLPANCTSPINILLDSE